MRQTIALLQLLCCAVLLLSCSGPKEEMTPLIPVWGQVNFTTDPPDAIIYIDDELQPITTPATISLVARAHQVRLSRQYYQDFSLTVLVNKETATDITAKLTSIFYPYTGGWTSQISFDPNPDQTFYGGLNLKVLDNTLTGTDHVRIGDVATPDGICLGKINDDQAAELLCQFGDTDHTDYWRAINYQISPVNSKEIKARFLYIDSYNRFETGAIFDRDK